MGRVTVTVNGLEYLMQSIMYLALSLCFSNNHYRQSEDEHCRIARSDLFDVLTRLLNRKIRQYSNASSSLYGLISAKNEKRLVYKYIYLMRYLHLANPSCFNRPWKRAVFASL